MSLSLKNGYFTPVGKQNNIDFWQPQGVYFLEKYDELSKLVAFGEKSRYFTD